MEVVRVLTASALCACLALAGTPAYGQAVPTGDPPGGFAGIPWGADAQRLRAKFGEPIVDGSQLQWDEIEVLGKSAYVNADVHAEVGLYHAAYVWAFGTGELAATQCSLHALAVRRGIIDKYGQPSRSGGGSCGEMYAVWESWDDPNITIDMLTQGHLEYGMNIFLSYTDQQRRRAAEQADVDNQL